MGFGFGLWHHFERRLALWTPLRDTLIGAKSRAAGLTLRHPLDGRYGVETQAIVLKHLLRTGTQADEDMQPYAGCVATVVENTLDRLGPLDGWSFLDLGCGKGRALIVAAHYPFARLIGIELNPGVAKIARRNYIRLRRHLPTAPPCNIRVGDASAPQLPEGDVVLFLYNPFGESAVRRLLAHLATDIAEARRIHIIYENPVHGNLFDALPGLRRVFSGMLPCEAAERPFAFDDEESVAIWTNDSKMLADASSGNHIRVARQDIRAVIETAA